MQPQRLFEQIDACRPLSDDLQLDDLAELAEAIEEDPQLAECYRQMQQVDVVLAERFHEVPVPEGLQARLLQSLASASPADESNSAELWEAAVPAAVAPLAEQADSEQPENARLATPAQEADKRWSTRSLYRSVGVLVLLVMVTITITKGVQWFMEEPMQVTASQLAEQAIHWQREAIAAEDWKAVDAQVSRTAPLPRSLQAVPYQWRRESTRQGDSMVVLDLSRSFDPPRSRLLFVLHESAEYVNFPETPPLSPQRSTGGCCVGAWREEGFVYVLAVRGSDQEYQSLMKLRGEMAWLFPQERSQDLPQAVAAALSLSLSLSLSLIDERGSES